MQDQFGSSVLGVLLLLVPFLKPWALLRSGEAPSSSWHSWVFRGASLGILCGIPLVVVYLLARHNFSGQGTELGRPLVSSDFTNWDSFWVRARREYDQREQSKHTTPAIRILELLKTEGAELQVPEEFREDLRWAWEQITEKHGQLVRAMQPVVSQSWPVYKKALDDRDRLMGILNRLLRGPGISEFLIWNEEEDLRANGRTLFHLEDTAVGPGELTNQEEASALLRLLDKQQADLKTHRSVFWHEPDFQSVHGKQQLALNHLLLRTYYPIYVRRVTTVVRPTVVEADQQRRLAWLFAALAVTLLSACLVNLNATSPQWFYRDQLSKAYVLPGPTSDTPKTLPYQLDTTTHGGPYHLISATLNLLGTEVSNSSNTSASFLFSKRYCGSQFTGYESTGTYQEGKMDLATAISVSGAAVSPMRVKNPLVAFLMTIMNLRLGLWLPRPGGKQSDQGPQHGLDWLRRQPTPLGVALDWLYRPEDRAQFFISDGGHDENLGIEQLLQRRCTFIVASDAGQDENHHFADLVKLYRRVRLQGIRFTRLDEPDEPLALDPLALDACTKDVLRQYTFARIHYPEGKQGLLVYLKPSCTGREEIDLTGHRREYPEFPHDPTTNMVYDENHVESYRQLGEFIARRVCRDLQTRSWKNPMDLQAVTRHLESQCRMALVFPEGIGEVFHERDGVSRPAEGKVLQGWHAKRGPEFEAPAKG